MDHLVTWESGVGTTNFFSKSQVNHHHHCHLHLRWRICHHTPPASPMMWQQCHVTNTTTHCQKDDHNDAFFCQHINTCHVTTTATTTLTQGWTGLKTQCVSSHRYIFLIHFFLSSLTHYIKLQEPQQMVTNTSTRTIVMTCTVATTITISIASQYQHHAASQPWLPPPGILNVSTPTLTWDAMHLKP